MSFSLAILALCWGARAAVIDSAPPSDAAGRWQVDLYDTTGAQRGSILNPLNVALPNPPTFSSRVVTGNQTVVVKTGSGILHSLVIGNGATGGAVAVYDGTSSAGTLILQVTAGTPSGGLLSNSGNPNGSALAPLEIAFTAGLTLVTSGATANSFTAVYR